MSLHLNNDRSWLGARHSVWSESGGRPGQASSVLVAPGSLVGKPSW